MHFGDFMKIHDALGRQLAPALANTLPSEPRNLPNRILRAIDNALHLSGLPRPARATLADICRFVPQGRPFDTVFAHKEKIAERTGASERTVYRHLQALQTAGMIEVLTQERKSRNGRFSVSRIRLTRRAAGLLGFIEMEEDLFIPDAIEVPSEVTQAELASKASDDESGALERPSTSTKIPVIHSLPSAILASGQSLSVPTLSKNQPPKLNRQPTQNGLPLDLAWLTGNGLSRAGVFGLMGIAKSKNKRLSDVVVVVKDYIADMKGGRLYAYLAALCKGPTDFSVAAVTVRKRLESEKEELAFKRKCKVFRERFKNTALTDRSQSKLYFIDERAAYVQVYGKREGRAAGCLGSAPLNDLSTWIKGIETGKLVLATLALEQEYRL
jgi:DNA-binding transcriptional ArsR family regulator